MITRLLALRLFEAFSIQRWNDLIRPVDMVEMDKQAFKSVLTYFFAKIEENNGTVIDWDYLVHGSVFSLLKNIMLSDIKAPVIKKIQKEHPEEYKNLNRWVVENWKGIIEDGAFLSRFEEFILSEDDEDDINLRIIRAAHKYSTYREFEILEQANNTLPRLKEYHREVREGIEEHNELAGVKEIFSKQQEFYDAICMIEQLRFQARWSQTQRTPQTSVLGHSMLVACIMLFMSRELNACNTRLCNNFYAGLFHDLPEVVVRDIISPVKRATSTLPEIVKKIELEVCEDQLYPKIPEEILEDIKYLIGEGLNNGDEFSNRIIEKGKSRILTDKYCLDDYNTDEFRLIDGKLIKAADEIAAFIEAEQSVNHGITSRHLQEGMAYIRDKYLNNSKIVNGIEVYKFFLEFI